MGSFDLTDVDNRDHIFMGYWGVTALMGECGSAALCPGPDSRLSEFWFWNKFKSGSTQMKRRRGIEGGAEGQTAASCYANAASGTEQLLINTYRLG